MAGKQYLALLKNEFSKSPLASNVAFGFILMGLEKLVELEFECPCNSKWNGVFSSAFFIIPAVMAFILMLIIQGCRCDTWCRNKTGNCFVPVVHNGGPSFEGQTDIDNKTGNSFCSKTVSSFVSAIVWLILMFFDGQYFACAMTYWEGSYVLLDKAAPQKWCEPNVTSQELMHYSQEQFVTSQVIGMVLLIFICVGLVVYLVIQNCQQEVGSQMLERQDTEEIELSAEART